MSSTRSRRRGNVKVNDAQSVPKVLAELTRRNQLGQVPVGGRNHANVNPGQRRIGAYCLNLTVFQEPQQQRLHAQAHLADLIEEERAAMRELELTHLVSVGAGEASFDVSEELRLEQRFRKSRAIDRDKRMMYDVGNDRGSSWPHGLCQLRFPR